MTPATEHTDGRHVQCHVEDEADYVVVGTGAAGATAAATLAKAGASVILIEEGEWLTTKDFAEPMLPILLRAFRDAAAQVAQGRAFIPLIQGRCVGGTTVINSAIVWRMPEDIHAEWDRDYGVGEALPYAALQKNYDQIEADINIQPTQDAAAGWATFLMEEGARRLGWHGERTVRYENRCKGSNRCIQGCPSEAKKSMAVSYVPEAIKNGARLYTCAKAEQFLQSGGRVNAVVAKFRDPASGAGRFELMARAKKAVLVGASAIQTPALLSRIAPGGGLGDHFRCHPGFPVFGLFDVPQQVWMGATQGYDVDHFRTTEGYKLEHLSIPMEMMMARLPGIGSELRRYMADIDRYAMWVPQTRFSAEGKVRGKDGNARIHFTANRADMERSRMGVRRCVELMFAAGAKKVLPCVHGLPTVLDSPDQLKVFDDAPLEPRAYNWLATHLFGTARMGADPKHSVVGHDFQVHRAPGLYVIDSSVFPTNMGVNPQHTIMAMSMLASQKLLDQH